MNSGRSGLPSAAGRVMRQASVPRGSCPGAVLIAAPASMREHAHGFARRLGFICSGTHPFSDSALQQVSPDPRYHRLVDEMQWPARRLQIFGIHVHVGVRSADKAIAMVNTLAGYIPHFLALSASSPWFEGRDTGLASSRTSPCSSTVSWISAPSGPSTMSTVNTVRAVISTAICPIG